MTTEPRTAQVLLRLIVGYRLSQALSVAARLGIADQLKGGPMSAEALAGALGAHASSLYRTLRLLASEGVFAEEPDGRFRLTPLAEPLLSDRPDSLRARAIYDGMPANWHAWANLLHSVVTGEPAFDHTHGAGLFEHLERYPDEASPFFAFIAAQTTAAIGGIVAAYDFSGVRTLVDVGGGYGALVAGVLQATPGLKGVLYDQPHVAAAARTVLESAGVATRCETVGGDFFASAPAGGDAYALKHILHDWDDERCLTILGNCRRAIPADGRLLVIEVLIPPGNAPHYGKYLDLNMLVSTGGGRERTEAEYRALLEASGFRLSRTVETASGISVIEGRPV